MKALTVKQPWASLIVHGIKNVENRTWKTNFRGRMLIHSSKETPKSLPSLYSDKFGVTCVAMKDTPLKNVPYWNYPCSSIIGSVEIVDCVQNYSSIWAEKSPSVWNWVLKDAVAFSTPIQAKGKLSFWDYPDVIAGSNGYSIGDIVPYVNTRQNIRYAKITYFERVDNGKVWFHEIDIDTNANVWYPIHLSITLIK